LRSSNAGILIKGPTAPLEDCGNGESPPGGEIPDAPQSPADSRNATSGKKRVVSRRMTA